VLQPFSLLEFSLEFPFSKTPLLSRIFLPFKNTNFSIFRSGAIISRASASSADLDSSFAWLRSILASFGLRMSENYTILNIVSTANLALPLDLTSLAPYLRSSSYDPSPLLAESDREFNVDAIVHYFNPNIKPCRTALVFSSGTVVLTGFNSFSDLETHAIELSSDLLKIMNEHPEVLR
jgi:TATA-box binding protein (TBP) (component of TFIID and TFIIIB)